jgi:hypothetical protein
LCGGMAPEARPPRLAAEKYPRGVRYGPPPVGGLLPLVGHVAPLGWTSILKAYLLKADLADTLSAIEMAPLRLRVRGTAGCGKSVLATPQGVYVDTFYGLMDRFLISRGHTLPYERIGGPEFWQDIQDRVIGETIGPDWKYDALIVDEGQDFEPQWSEILRLFLKPDADILSAMSRHARLRWRRSPGAGIGRRSPDALN